MLQPKEINEKIFHVGAAVLITLGSYRGQKAIVYEVYDRSTISATGGRRGVSLITTEGRELGGWSEKEAEDWLLYLGQTSLQDYEFKGLNNVARDLRAGIFTQALQEAAKMALKIGERGYTLQATIEAELEGKRLLKKFDADLTSDKRPPINQSVRLNNRKFDPVKGNRFGPRSRFL